MKAAVPKGEMLAVRVSEVEKAVLTAAAAAEGRTMSELVSEIVFPELARRHLNGQRIAPRGESQ